MRVRILHRILWAPLRFLFWLLADLRAFGLERIRNVEAPAIFVSNHRNRFDPFLVGIALPSNSPHHGIHWLAADDEFRSPLRRFGFWLLGAFRGNASMSYREVLARPTELLERGKSVGVFPEWCYEDDVQALELMQHVVPLLAERTRRPVIPVFLFGIEQTNWYNLLRRRLRANVTFGKSYHPPADATVEEIERAVNRALLQTRLAHLRILHGEEQRFWEEYGAFYAYLERADAYRELLADFRALLPETLSGTWLDLGSGSGAVAAHLHERAGPAAKIIASDYNETMLTQLRNRFTNDAAVEKFDLSRRIPMRDHSVDGITANLVLSYIIHHQGVVGPAALQKLLQELARVLRPGGTLIWSTPKENVRFILTFIRSLPSILRSDQRENLIYGPRILMQAFAIAAKGRRGVYHFFNRQELEKTMSEAGFRNIVIRRSMAQQVYLIRAEGIG